MSSEDGAGNKQTTIRRFLSQLPHSQLLEQQVTVIRTIMQSTNTVKQEGNPAIVLKRCEKMLIQMRMETHLKEVRNNCKSKWSDLLPFKDGRQINCRIRYGLFEFVILKTEQPIVLRVAVCTRARVEVRVQTVC